MITTNWRSKFRISTEIGLKPSLNRKKRRKGMPREVIISKSLLGLNHCGFLLANKTHLSSAAIACLLKVLLLPI